MLTQESSTPQSWQRAAPARTTLAQRLLFKALAGLQHGCVELADKTTGLTHTFGDPARRRNVVKIAWARADEAVSDQEVTGFGTHVPIHGAAR